MKLITNKKELIKELQEMFEFLNATDEEITEKYPYIKDDGVDPFKVGYIRTNIKYLISDLTSKE